MKGTSLAVVVVCSLALAVAASASAYTPITGWTTPNRAVVCVALVAEGDEMNETLLECWTPNDGFYVSMYGQGRVKKGYAARLKGKPGYDESHAVGLLSFGERFRLNAPGFVMFQCVSRKTGLTCTNHDGHGWWLGRFKGHKVF